MAHIRGPMCRNDPVTPFGNNDCCPSVVPDDPFIVVDNVVLDNRRDRWFENNWIRWIAVLVPLVSGLGWGLFRMDLSREPELPNRPLTKADVPLLEKKIKFLKADAEKTSRYFPHLRNEAEIQAALQAWEEVYYTQEVFPAAAKLHDLQNQRILETHPELAGPLHARDDYEVARFSIANNPAITDKAAAVAALKERLRPLMKSPDYSQAAQVKAAQADLVGDPEIDQLQKDYQRICETAILKRHPELAAFYHDVDNRDEASHHFLAQANDLSRQMEALKNGGTPPAAAPAAAPAATTAATPVTKPVAPTVAATAAAVNTGGRVHVSTNAPVGLAPPALPEAAERLGVKIGDTVEVSAMTPAVAARHALITAMNDEQVTIEIGVDTFNIRWENLIHLKVGGKK